MMTIKDVSKGTWACAVYGGAVLAGGHPKGWLIVTGCTVASLYRDREDARGNEMLKRVIQMPQVKEMLKRVIVKEREEK